MNKLITVLVVLFLAVIRCYAHDNSQADLRLNPEIESSAGSAAAADYPFLKLEDNAVILNGDDWSSLAAKYKAALEGESLFSVVYLGDSHIQADFGGAVLRAKLSGDRRAGRGIMIPFRLAGTNQPLDYRINTTEPYVSSRLLKMPWATDMPFTGVGIRPVSRDFSFELSSDIPFSRLRFFHKGGVPELARVEGARTDSLAYKIESTSDYTVLELDRSMPAVSIAFKGDKSTVFSGVEALSDTLGVVVHSIGNNGACYSSYGLIEGFGSGLSMLEPDLVVIALGTNEAFGRSTSVEIEADIAGLIGKIRRHNPKSKILLVSPAECYKKVYRRTKKRNGRRRRTAATVVNTKIATVRETVQRYAAESGIAFYDHYAVAGGAGAAAELKKAGLLGRDGIHYSTTAYRLWGALLADAIAVRLLGNTTEDDGKDDR